MTDIAPDPGTPPTAPAPAPTTVAEAVDWQAKYQQEVEHRRRERNLYAPVAKVFEGLPDEDRDVIAALADAVRNRDVDAVVGWSLDTTERLTGKSVADVIAARQAAAGNAPTDIGAAPAPQEPSQALTADQIKELTKQAIVEQAEEVQRQARVQAIVERMSTQLRDSGYEPGSSEAVQIVQMARALSAADGSDPDIGKAIQVYQLAQTAQAAALSQAAAAAGQVPPPAPTGLAGGTAPAPDATPRERVMARLAAKRV